MSISVAVDRGGNVKTPIFYGLFWECSVHLREAEGGKEDSAATPSKWG